VKSPARLLSVPLRQCRMNDWPCLFDVDAIAYPSTNKNAS
jgi:hypothetical protein